MFKIPERLKGLAGRFGLAGLAAAGRLDAESSQRRALRAGFLGCLSVPGLILFCSAAGYGALARDSGFSLFNAAFMMAVLYALPAQVVVIDQLARGASIWAGGVLGAADGGAYAADDGDDHALPCGGRAARADLAQDSGGTTSLR